MVIDSTSKFEETLTGVFRYASRLELTVHSQQRQTHQVMAREL